MPNICLNECKMMLLSVFLMQDSKQKIEDCLQFIKASQVFNNDINLAVVDENDEYMGTVSLKHINYKTGTAEFAIKIHKCVMGKGYSIYGMKGKRVLSNGTFLILFTMKFGGIYIESTNFKFRNRKPHGHPYFRTAKMYDRNFKQRNDSQPSAQADCRCRHGRSSYDYGVL